MKPMIVHNASGVEAVIPPSPFIPALHLYHTLKKSRINYEYE